MSNGYNNNFLDDFEQEEFAEQESAEETTEEQTQLVLSEAIKRIEQAKLYETLLKHRLFGEGSARPEIMAIVETEIKQFILSRLEVLLGIKPSAQAEQVPAKSQFDEAQVEALKALANRLIQKEHNTPTTPSINQMPVVEPKIQQVRPIQPTINPVGGGQAQVSQPQQVAAKKRPPRRARSQNVSQVAIQNPDGSVTPVEQDYSQAVNPRKPPLAMPSQAVIDQMNAQTAASNAGAASSAVPVAGASPGAGNVLSQMINLAAQQMVAKNANVKE